MTNRSFRATEPKPEPMRVQQPAYLDDVGAALLISALRCVPSSVDRADAEEVVDLAMEMMPAGISRTTMLGRWWSVRQMVVTVTREGRSFIDLTHAGRAAMEAYVLKTRKILAAVEAIYTVTP